MASVSSPWQLPSQLRYSLIALARAIYLQRAAFLVWNRAHSGYGWSGEIRKDLRGRNVFGHWHDWRLPAVTFCLGMQASEVQVSSRFTRSRCRGSRRLTSGLQSLKKKIDHRVAHKFFFLFLFFYFLYHFYSRHAFPASWSCFNTPSNNNRHELDILFWTHRFHLRTGRHNFLPNDSTNNCQ